MLLHMAPFPALASYWPIPIKNKKEQIFCRRAFPGAYQISSAAHELKCDRICAENTVTKGRENLSSFLLHKNRIIKSQFLLGSRNFQRSWLFSCDRQHLCFSLRALASRRRLEIWKVRHEMQIRCKYGQQSHGKGKGLGKSAVMDQNNLPVNENDHHHPKRPFSFRLQGRMRLLLRYLRKCSPNTIAQVLITLLRQYSRQVTLSTALGSVLGLCYLGLKLTAVPSSEIVPYSDLVTKLQAGTVTSALFEEGSRRIFFNMYSQTSNKLQSVENKVAEHKMDGFRHMEGDELRSGAETHLSEDNASTEGVIKKALVADVGKRSKGLVSRFSGPRWQYSTRRIEHDESYLLSLMREHGIKYSSAPQPVSASIRSVLITIISLWIPLSPFIWLLHRQISANSSSAQKRRSSKQVVRFEDVAGVDAAKEELMEIVLCLQGAINFRKLGAKLPKGVLLVGPPGTGKTLLARAVAGEAGVPFFAASASEFVELFVGRGAARIRDLFNVARKCAPSIIFIDELDAVGGRRGRSFNDERDQTLNQLLTEMDGFESDTGVLVIAATNRPEALDPALCRPGRFSRRVFVREPDVDGRRKILAIHLRGIPLEQDPEMICNMVASITSGFVGADLANVVNEAALLTARQGRDTVTMEDLKAAVYRAKYGIGDKVSFPTVIGKELGRLFPWIPSQLTRTIQDSIDEQPLGYQTIT
eukprot:Gb_32360 [translate_table: standard]